jgi:indole-3-acetate monooxygenase
VTLAPETITRGDVGLSAAEIRERAAALGPLIRRDADEIASIRHLTPAVLEGLREAGVFRMAFPRSWGGPEMRVRDQIEMIADLGYHDASVAWNVMILADSGFYALLSEPETAEELFPTMDLATAGAARPAGRAVETEDGYELSGDWSFSSGIRNADRILGGFHRIVDGEPVLNSEGFPELFTCWIPTSAVVLHDTWHTTGLAGSGSTSYSVRNVTVPKSWLFPHRPDGDPATPPLTRHAATFTINGSAPVLGLARRAIEEFRLFATKPTRMDPTRSLKDQNPAVPVALARATALYEAAMAMALATADDVDETLFSGGSLTAEQQARAAYTGWVVGRLCRDAVETVMEVVGARGVLASNPFDRLYRDLATIARHNVHNDTVLTISGRVMLGMPVGSHLIG